MVIFTPRYKEEGRESQGRAFTKGEALISTNAFFKKLNAKLQYVKCIAFHTMPVAKILQKLNIFLTVNSTTHFNYCKYCNGYISTVDKIKYILNYFYINTFLNGHSIVKINVPCQNGY